MLKIGYLNFWEGFDNNSFYDCFGRAFTKHNIEYKIVDSYSEQTDIVFVCCFGNDLNVNRIFGNPIKIYYSGESSKYSSFNYNIMKTCDYSMTFFNDTETNLYLPIWMMEFDTYNECVKTINRNFEDKSKFCSFMYRHCMPYYDGSNLRGQLFNELSNYKHIDSIGSWNKNVSFDIPRFGEHPIETQKILEKYKFAICFENNSSNPNENYITEKLINGYVFGSVPIYRGGGDRLLDYFNDKSFINCNGKNVQEVVDIVKYYDTHDDEYKEMLCQPLLKNEIDYKEYSYDKIYNFLKKHNVI